ncbi:hypothetical protein JCM8097_001791 [Rhodosporidiobolus ruineniae]
MPFTLTRAHLDAFLVPASQGDWGPFKGAIDPEARWWITSDEARRGGKVSGYFDLADWIEHVNKPLLRRLDANGLKMSTVSVSLDAENLRAFMWIYRFDGETGKVVEIREYMDSALVCEVWATNP